MALLPPRSEGIWAGLWQLPDQYDTKNAFKVKPVTQGKHQLTHRSVDYSITVLFGTSNQICMPDLTWVNQKELNGLAFPKPVAQFWKNNSLSFLSSQTVLKDFP